MNLSILLVDDDLENLNILRKQILLLHKNFSVFSASNKNQAREILHLQTIDLVITDYRMPDTNGLEILKMTKKFNPDIDVIVMTAFADIKTCIEVIKEGASDYLIKPVEMNQMEIVLARIRKNILLVKENQSLRNQIADKAKVNQLIYQSKEMENVLNLTLRYAKSNSTILIRGESGTGKELIAHIIHKASSRSDKPFITVNIGAIPENLIESELFGYKKGAFTGAIENRIGLFEEADQGTLFIDEIAEIPPSIQVKLLRAIQFKQIRRLGDAKNIKVNVRIIGATHKNLEKMIQEKELREDFYYRLNVLPIHIPALRERKDDIPILINHLVQKLNLENEKNIKGISHVALDMLTQYDFPGNIRELENIIERAVILAQGDFLLPEDFPPHIHKYSPKQKLDFSFSKKNYKEIMSEFEKSLIQETLESLHWNQSAAARKLEISERHVRSIMKRLSLKKPELHSKK